MTDPGRDFFKDKASKLYGIPYGEVTDEQRAELKKRIFDYLYGRSDDNPLSAR